jgi:hypothetical protein
LINYKDKALTGVAFMLNWRIVHTPAESGTCKRCYEKTKHTNQKLAATPLWPGPLRTPNYVVAVLCNYADGYEFTVYRFQI